MEVYKIDVFDNDWKLISSDFFRCKDRQAAETRAKADATWLGCEKWEITRIR